MDYVKDKTSFNINETIADRAYGSEHIISSLRDKKITTYIPLFSSRSGSSENSIIPGFQYNEVNNYYVCPQNNFLRPCKSQTDTTIYISSTIDCKRCSLSKTCLAKLKNKGAARYVTRNRYAELYSQMILEMDLKSFQEKLYERMWKIEGIMIVKRVNTPSTTIRYRHMPSREQTYVMLMLRKRNNNFFSTLPSELITEIATFDEGPSSDIGKALKYAAYAREEDVEALFNMLDENPSLLLETGNVKTPGGDEIRRVTIYEFALGAGDYELAERVQGYFSKIGTKDAEQQRIRQYERYKPHIDGMLTQKPYDLGPLIQIIKDASAEDVTALLNKDMTRESKLRDAIIQFRKDWAPRILTKPCMPYNYASLQYAFELLKCEWNNLYKTSGNTYNKIDLVWRQLIGFEMRRLPGIDRCVMAQGLYSVIEEEQDVERSYTFNRSNQDFPIIADDNSLAGLGVDFSVESSAGEVKVNSPLWSIGDGCAMQFGQLMSNKNSKLAGLMQSQPVSQPTRCIIL